MAMGYGVVGFGLIQAADFIFPRIQFAPYAVDWVLAGVLLAFPLVLVVAPGGSAIPRRSRRLD